MSEYRPRVHPDALYREPEAHDSAHPAGGALLTVHVGGCRLFGMLYLPQGPGPHPVAMLLHGLPGAVRSEDVAQALRRAGVAAFIFSYRGSWGSEGDWSYMHCREDAMAAWALLRDPHVMERYHLDPDHGVILGHSLGGLMALLVARDTAVRDLVLMSPADAGKQWRASMSMPHGQVARIERLRKLCEPLHGSSAEQIWEDVAANLDDFDVMPCIPRLTNKRFLMIAAEHDTLLPPEEYFTPVVEALHAQLPGCVRSRILPTGHNYNSHRMELMQEILQWLHDLGY